MDLLNQKNHYLEKFFALNESSFKRFMVGDFDSIEQFYQDREKILEIMSYLESQIEIIQVQNSDSLPANEDYRSQIKNALDIKNEYVRRIVIQDLEILSCIETTKSHIIKELGEIQKARKGVKGYKSPTFNQRLDEEA